MKLIDILNMISKGELKEGTKVKYKNIEWEYKTFGNKGEKDLVDRGNFTLFEQFYMDALSEEVELIEPPCEHGCIADVGKSIEPTDNTKIEELNIDFGNEIITCNHFQILATNKLNEVINKVNAQTEVILAHRKDIDEIKERLDY